MLDRRATADRLRTFAPTVVVSHRSRAAIKKGRERERERAGLGVFAIETHHYRLIEALLLSGRLSEQQALRHPDLARSDRPVRDLDRGPRQRSPSW
jgi:hypothetical protein